MNNYFKLEDVADVKLSNVDKKVKTGEKEIRLCNYTDVYKNTYIDKNRAVNFMIASCNEKEFEKFLLKKGQVSITKDSEKANDIGVSTYIEEDFQDVVLGYHLALITPYKEKLDGKYLNYWFNTSQAKRYFENNVGGSGQRFTLLLDVILSTPLFLPNIENQKKISSILFLLDKKIQLLHQINDNLAELAKTIYDYWFVQFDFPDQNGKPYKTSGGKMVYNEVLKREIPEGWEVKKLGEVIEKISNNILPTEYQNLNYLPIDFLPKRQFYYDKYDLRENALSSLIKFDEDDILLGAMRVYFHRVCNAIEDGISRNTIFVLRPFEKENKNYCLFLLDEEKTIQFANDNSTGSSIPYAKWDNGLANYQLVLPKKNILSLFNLKINPIIKKLKINSKQIQHLRSLRDWLLPMLMNGQISVE